MTTSLTATDGMQKQDEKDTNRGGEACYAS